MIELENDRRYLNQWRLEQRVQIDGFLPGTWVDFSIVNDGRNGTLTTEAYEECGHVYANIPNVLLQNFGYLHIYVNPAPSDMAHTPEEKDIKIVRRKKPSFYIYTETPTVSYSSKVNIFWGEEHAGKSLVVGEDGYVTTAGSTSGGNTGGESTGGDVATDDEVNDMFDDVFDKNEGSGGGETPNPENPNPENPGDDNTGDENVNGDIATDEEVNDMFDDIFG